MSRADATRAAVRLFVCLFLLTLAALLWAEHLRGRPAGSQFGWQPDAAGVREFLLELDQPFFQQAAPECMTKAADVDTFLYRQMNAAHRARYGAPFVVGRQGIGDCVSWGAAHAVYAADSVDWSLGKIADPPLLPATESIYGGSRVEARGRSGDGASPLGGWSDGSYGGAAAKWLRDWGVIYRQPYDGVDLTTYSADRAKSWGAFGNGGQGDRGRLDAVAKKHPCRHVAAVRTWGELVAAVTAGYPVTIASDQGFVSRTDESGVAAASGQWMHQMVIIGLRFAKNAPPGVRPVDAALVLNSWGTKWITYAGKYPGDQPDGSFWAERRTVERILGQGDSYAIGSVDGFGWRDINHGNWLAPAPIESQVRVP